MEGLTINGMTLVKHVWFNSRTIVGIVICKDDITHELKSYIGAGGEGRYLVQTGSVGEVNDLSNIMMWGASFPIEQAKILCNYKE